MSKKHGKVWKRDKNTGKSGTEDDIMGNTAQARDGINKGKGKPMGGIREFYRGKKVLVTGHTGFKGTWLCKILTDAGAEVTGYALSPPAGPDLFGLSCMEGEMDSVIGDIRDRERLCRVFERVCPEVVFHLAAQPIVRSSYIDPVYTYEANVMGTVNVCECVRKSGHVKSFLNVTTDKVYLNREWDWGYRETDALDGYDPYSNSKSCSELVTHSYRNSFFKGRNIAVSTARAGNVIGGGDFAADRIIPDCVRAVMEGRDIVVRNPHSVRPYQHVLEPLFAYLMIAKKQYEDISYADFYNVGPDDCDCLTTGELVTVFCEKWGNGQTWLRQGEDKGDFHEACLLRLDCSRLKNRFGWAPRWHIDEAVEKTCEFTRVYMDGGSIVREMEREIGEFVGG
mgnify:CR=1 FL=1